jgi:hypothetical protein
VCFLLAIYDYVQVLIWSMTQAYGNVTACWHRTDKVANRIVPLACLEWYDYSSAFINS